MKTSFFRASREELEQASLGPRDTRRLALLVLYGHRGFTADPARAIALLEAAVGAGDSAAALQLGDMYLRGRGAPADEAVSRRHYLRAAELGNSAAQANVASFFVKSDPKEARRWFELAAAQGQPYAVRSLKQLGGTAPPLPTPTLLAFAMTPLVELAVAAGPASPEERELALLCGDDAAAVSEGFRLWLEALDAAWPDLLVRVELGSTPCDFPHDAIPSAVMEDDESIELAIRPRGSDTLYTATLSYDEEQFQLSVASSDPHPDGAKWGWFVAQLESALVKAGVQLEVES